MEKKSWRRSHGRESGLGEGKRLVETGINHKNVCQGEAKGIFCIIFIFVFIVTSFFRFQVSVISRGSMSCTPTSRTGRSCAG